MVVEAKVSCDLQLQWKGSEKGILLKSFSFLDETANHSWKKSLRLNDNRRHMFVEEKQSDPVEGLLKARLFAPGAPQAILAPGNFCCDNSLVQNGSFRRRVVWWWLYPTFW